MYRKQSREAMLQAGWELDDARPKPCRQCQQPIYWGRNPEGRNISFDFGTVDFHFKGCPGKPAAKTANALAAPAPEAAAPAPASAKLQASIDALTAEVRRLITILQSRRATATPPAARRFDSDECPM